MFRHTLVNNFLEYSADRLPDKVALVHQDKRYTYGEIDAMANRLARALVERGVERGDRVAIFMDNAIETVVSIFGALKAGAAFMVINHTTKAKKLRYILGNSRAKALLTQSSRADVVRGIDCPFLEILIISGPSPHGLPCIPFEEIMNSGRNGTIRSQCIDLDLAAVIYTSGSTGQPKGVTLSHCNMVSAAHSITTYLENNEHDVIINVLPLSFDYGLYQILMGFKIGGTVVLEKSFTYPYQVIDTMIKEKVTGLPGVPTIFAILLGLKNIQSCDFRSLRYITNTAAALPVSHIRRLRELFPQAKLYSMYGLTECKRVSYLPPDEIERRPTSIGKGMPNEEVYIVNEQGERVGPGEVGELVVRGSNVMLGYWEMPEETAKCLQPGKYPGERVLHTGDLFKMDEEGYLYFVARKDDIIKCKGEKVSPKEVENVLYTLDGIREAAVVGVPDEISGQAVKAYVALEDGSRLTEKDILLYCSQHLENFMVPKYIEIRGSLPKTVTGKISKSLLTTSHRSADHDSIEQEQ
jgi:amino acid adenylation domain-containing protein